jgi:hypothetical protein
MVDMENELRNRVKAAIRARALSHLLIDDFLCAWERLEGISFFDCPACVDASRDPLDRLNRFVEYAGGEDDIEPALDEMIDGVLNDIREICQRWEKLPQH